MTSKLLRRLSVYFILLTAISVVALAQRPARSLTPSLDRLREIITYLASDALEGRRTGSAGANDAARYLAGEFQRLGLRPGVPQAQPTRLGNDKLAQYRQQFPYVAGVELGKGNVMSVQTKDASSNLRVGE